MKCFSIKLKKYSFVIASENSKRSFYVVIRDFKQRGRERE